jgi:hypothetical protein
MVDPDAFRNVPRGPAAGTPAPNHPPLPLGWKAAIAPNGKTYYYRRSDNKTQWDFPVEEPVQPDVSVLQKSELQKFIEEASRQQAEKLAAQKAEEERKREEVEKEEKEAAEAKAKERAERKLQRDQHRHQRRASDPDTAKSGKSKLEKELSVQVKSIIWVEM